MKINNRKNITQFFIVAIVLLIFIKLVFSQPAPQNIDGWVFANGTPGSQNGVQEGTIVTLNNTNGNDFVITETMDLGIPELRGIYSATIVASTGHRIEARSWNLTHYGVTIANIVSGSTTINISINYSRPSETNVTIIIPSNNSKRNTTNSFNLTANVSVFGGNGANCNATIYFSNSNANITSDNNLTNNLGNININNFQLTTWNISGLRHGFVNITVVSQCQSDGINLYGVNQYKISTFINDTTPPRVDLLSPSNSSWTKTNITFYYNVSENSGIKNCSLYIDNLFNQSSLGVPAYSGINFTLNNTPDGSHNWKISCHDNSTNNNQGNSSLYFFNVDGAYANITLLYPLNNSVLENYLTVFKYNVTDNLNVSNCTIIINQQNVWTNRSIAQNISNNFTVSLTGGNYNWSVNCSDNSNNIANSGYFSILTPDFFINGTYLVFSKYSFVERETIEINATVFNLGPANWTRNISIVLYENYNTTRSLLKNQSVNITAGSNVTLSYNYTTSIGSYKIFAFADPDNSFNGTAIESDEGNNIANRSLSVSSHNIYYGDIKSDIVLDTSMNLSVIAWSNVSNFRGVLFAADSDSTLGFSSFIALTRNTSGDLRLDDLEDIDRALNSTNNTDSINRTYIENLVLKGEDSFTIFSSLIPNVPIINSTNTSSFVTGIIWDSSDPNNGNYNGTQDVVFITKISKYSDGSFGTYDYEIKIPANLRRYVQPDVDSTITFYREII